MRRTLKLAVALILVIELATLALHGQVARTGAPMAGATSRSKVQSVDTNARSVEMRRHYSELVAIHDALVRGDLGAARVPAAELAYLSVPVGSPQVNASFGASIRNGARRVVHEATVVGAARAMVDIVRGCAGCHRASDAAISPDVVLRRQRNVPAGMADHLDAADDLLLGLLLPSDSRWASGVDRLQSSMAHAPLTETSSAFNETLRYVARRSERSTSQPARASDYVQLITTCVDCHRKGVR
jgi:hypothetical protein